MAKVIWTDPALADLNEIADFVAKGSADSANELVRAVFAATDLLEQHPELGRVPVEVKGLPYREMVVRPCRIFYRYDRERDGVFVVFVMRGERQFEVRYLLERELKIQGIKF